jgi:hypothetical protein
MIFFLIPPPREHVKRNVINPFDIPKYKQLFEHEDECVIHQVNYDDVNQVVFYPYANIENHTKYIDTIAVFKVKRKLTNMMIADLLINEALKNEAI